MHYKSVAVWPAGTIDFDNNVTEDSHEKMMQAGAVCNQLHKYGFGMEGRIFPVKTMIVEVANDGTETVVAQSPDTILIELSPLQAKFEEWYKQQYWAFPDSIRKPQGGYFHLDVQLAWRAYKAGAEEKEKLAEKLGFVYDSASALLKRCDDEGLILGGGQTFPPIKEGPMVKKLRKAINEVVEIKKEK